MTKWSVLLGLLVSAFSFPALAHVTLETRFTQASFIPGDKITINWSILVEHDQIDWALLFSDDGGKTWEAIEEGLPLYQLTYDWEAPQMESSQMLVQIVQNNDMTEDYYDISDTFTIVRETTTPVLDFKHLSLNAQFYPNPVQDEATFILSHGTGQQKSVVIYNMQGAIVERLTLKFIKNDQEYYQWRTGSYPSGVYLVSVELPGTMRSFPIIINH